MHTQPQQPTVIIHNQSSQALPALVNFFLPGLGQLIQGRLIAAVVWWVVLLFSVSLIFFAIGIITTPVLYIACIIDAARYKPRPQRVSA
jgi:TM2 domain-containing membrane protein YozV